MSQSRARAEPPAPAGGPVGLVVALGWERRALEGGLQGARRGHLAGRPVVRGHLAGRPVVLLQAGLGAERAAEAARLAVARFACASLWSLGLAAGLDPALRTGDLLLAARVGTGRAPAAAASRAAPLAAVLRLPHLHLGELLTASSPVLTVEAKAALRRATAAAALDMEAAGLVAVAEAARLPWLALKAVLDPAHEPLPPFLLAGAGRQGGLRPAAVLAGCCLHPARLRTLCAFAGRSRRALRSLAAAVEPALRAWARLDADPAVR